MSKKDFSESLKPKSAVMSFITPSVSDTQTYESQTVKEETNTDTSKPTGESKPKAKATKKTIRVKSITAEEPLTKYGFFITDSLNRRLNILKAETTDPALKDRSAIIRVALDEFFTRNPV
jgi:hypothetical protein